MNGTDWEPMSDNQERFEEGWYFDPFGRHEARWLSQGRPTALVLDGEQESSDPPPDTSPVSDAVPYPPREPQGRGADDLRRADDEQENLPGIDEVMDAASADEASLVLHEDGPEAY